MQRVLRLLGWGLLGMAGLVILFLVYQLFITDFFNARSQARAEVELETSLDIRRAELAIVTTTTATTTPVPEDPVDVVPPPESAATSVLRSSW